MGLRETINEKPRVAVAVAGGLVFLGLVAAVLQLRGSAPPAGPEFTRAFFSVDDGKTWFEGDATKLAPFDHEGKPAVRAYVYRCGGTEFVNHLERYKPDAKRTLEEAAKPDPTRTAPPNNMGAIQAAHLGGREVKRPGDAKWTPAADFRAAGAIIAPKCPGSADGGRPEPIQP
jgi:hypothetical protein